MTAVFREVRRILRPDGTLWLNIGDSYISNPGDRNKVGGIEGKASNLKKLSGSCMSINKHNIGLKPKDLCMIPARLALALQADGWWVRSDIIWAKPNPMPESVTDRPTKSHEYIYLLTKAAKYYYNADAIREDCISGNGVSQGIASGKRFGGDSNAGGKVSDFGCRELFNNPNGRNARSVWNISTQPTPDAHFATFPEELVRRCMLAGSKEGDTIFDPFMGSGTTALVALRGRRHYIGIELNPDYIKIADKRLARLKSQKVLI